MRLHRSALNGMIFLLLLALLMILDGCAAKTSLIIDQSGNGDYRSIRKALDDWEPGQHLFIRPGVYDEQVILQTFMTIEGLIDQEKKESGPALGNPDAVVVEFTGGGPAMVGSNISEAKVSNISFRIKAKSKQSTVQLTSADISIDNCTISGGERAGIESANFGRLDLKNSIVEGNGFYGIFLHHQARANIENSTIRANDRGVYISRYPDGIPPSRTQYREEDAGDILLKANTITGNKILGILASDGTEAELIANTISWNGVVDESEKESSGKTVVNYDMAGLVLKNRSRIKMSENILADNSIGLVLQSSSGGTFVGNTITRNSNYGVIVAGNMMPEILRNSITENGSGIILKDSAKALIKGNQIVSNKYQGIEVASMASPTIERNWIIRNGQSGIYIFNNSKPIIRYNIFVENKWYGLLAANNSHPRVGQNTFYRNGRVGAWFTTKSEGFFINNVVVGSKAGLSIKGNSELQPTITGNCVWKNDLEYEGFSENPPFDISENPLFTNPAKLDFTPMADSPLIQKDGTHTYIGAVDLAGRKES